VSTDSPVADRFVAAPDNWTRNGAPIRGIVIHMAEGGGTVTWLTRLDGNSSHYVVEYDGSVTQMVLEARAAGSMNPKITRADDDAPFTYLGATVRYGITALKAALGVGSTDPNRYVIAIETEGFAATGPNAKQRAALARLVADIRKRRGALAVIGHRDQQNQKACPGRRIPWVDYGGHAVKRSSAPAPMDTPVTEETMQSFSVPEVRTLVTLKADPARPGNSAWIYSTSACVKDGKEVSLAPVRPLVLVGFASPDVYIVAYEPSTPDANATSIAMFARVLDIAKTEPAPAPPDPSPYTKAQLDAAVAAARAQEHASVKAKAVAAVEAL
jgi:hypothetical protein